MLSIGAFNALLKTLEEPPAYVIFILATTEVHKIPITILSRCQRYDFKRISLETIADRLRELTQAEQIQAEDKALMYIAKAADGSLRDGLSLLDQCVAFHYGKLLTYENALEVLGGSGFQRIQPYVQCGCRWENPRLHHRTGRNCNSGPGAGTVCYRFHLVSAKSSSGSECR